MKYHSHTARHSRRPILFHALGLTLVLMWLCPTASAQSGGTNTFQLVSFNAAGTAASNYGASAPQASADGRYVLFESDATDLVSTPDNNSRTDIFVRDTQTGTTALVSVNADGTATGNDASSQASITPDGRYVLFTSAASDLVSGDTNGRRDVFRRDMQTGTTVLVSANAAGTTSGNDYSLGNRITPDGRYVLFTSQATDLLPGGTSGPAINIFRRDMQTGTTTLVNVNAAGAATSSSDVKALGMTPDGRYVLFSSSRDDLVTNDTNGRADLFRRDLQTGTTALASTNSDGTRSGNYGAGYGEMSDDGRFVAFESGSTDLTPDYNNAVGTSVFFHDITTNTTVLISLPLSSVWGPSLSPRISHDGRYVIFERVDTNRNRVSGVDLSHDQVLRWDRQRQQIINFPSINDVICQHFGSSCKAYVSGLTVSPDGRYVAYKQTEFFFPSKFPPYESAGLVVLDTLGQGFQLLSDFESNDTSRDYRLFTVEPGNIVQGPKLTFSSPNSHASQDTNSFEDVYLYSPSAHPGSFSLTPATQDVGEAAGSATFTVSRSGFFGDSTASIDYATSDGTAKAGSDYTASSGTFNFGPGDSYKTFTVPIIDDQLYEGNETFKASLSNPTGGDTLSASRSAVVNIIDDEQPSLTIADAVVTEGTSATNTTALVKLTVSPAPFSPVSVSYATADTGQSDDAVAGKDYVRTSGTVTFNAGETTKEIAVPIVADDIHEFNQNFYVNLSQPRGVTIERSQAKVTIVDDDTAYLRFSADNYNVGEGDGSANVTVLLTNADGRPIKTETPVSCSWAPYTTGTPGTPGVATPGLDYLAIGGAISFGPGDTSSARTITIPIRDDRLVEGNETFAVRIFNPHPSFSTVIPVQFATVTIIDNQMVQFAAPTFTAREDSGVATISVTRAGDASAPFSVSYTTSNGTASPRCDYIAARGRLDFAAGEMSKTFQVLLVNDAFVEPDETVNLTLSDPTSPVVLGPQSTAQLTITSDDAAPPTANPADDARFFVTQHYLDFLNRLPDQSGLDFWTGELNRLLTACDSVPAGDARRRCQLGARAQVSTAFFLSIEFQQTGFYVIRLYEASFGRSPTLSEFSADVQRIANGVVVGAPGWEQQLETNKQRFTDEWMQRPSFSLIYSDRLSNTDYVSRLFYNGAGNDRAEPALLTQLVNGLDHTQTPFETRATALRKVTESYSVTDRQYNPALVLMQYYGYLRREPDDAPDGNRDGYNFWLNKLSSFSQPGEDMRDPNQALARIRSAQMIEAFIDSGEYRGRFGP